MKKYANLILENGRIWTVDPQKPWAEAVAVRSERILQVGSNAEISGRKGPETEILDLGGKLVLPGFIDSHTHFLDGGFSLTGIRLRDVSGKDEFISRIGARAKELGPGRWILDGEWDHQRFDPPVFPAREWIDGLTTENPVCICRMDLHMVLVNSLALKIAGISNNTPSPAGGEIEKNPATGEPTGILKDKAMELVREFIPEYSLKEKKQALLAGLKHAARFGVTSVHDMMFFSDFAAYQALERENKLTARIYIYTNL